MKKSLDVFSGACKEKGFRVLKGEERMGFDGIVKGTRIKTFKNPGSNHCTCAHVFLEEA